MRIKTTTYSDARQKRCQFYCHGLLQITDSDSRRVYGVGFDITNQRERLSEALDADKRKDRFLALVTHEMRNPLSSFASGLRLLERANLDPEGKVDFHGHSSLEVLNINPARVIFEKNHS